MKVLLHPTYFPDILSFSVLAQEEVVWEMMDNFQKQTYRNRCYICTDQGMQMLNIPIRHVGGKSGRQKYADVLLDNSYPWQRQHWRTLQTAYRTSPFFEFYEDDIAALYDSAFESLLQYNLETIKCICSCLDLPFPTAASQEYQLKPEAIGDGRFLVDAKKDIAFEQATYQQVFGERHGFVKNCSILDLLFNLGPSTSSYLKEQPLDFLHA